MTGAEAKRPALLFLSHRLPYPPHNGAALRTYNILRMLARHYDIDALCFDRRDTATSHLALADRIDHVRAIGRFTAFRIPQEGSQSRFLWDHVRSVVARRAYTYYVHESRSFSQSLLNLMRSRPFRLVHVDSLDMVRYLEQVPPERIVLTHHNVESQLLARRAAAESSAARRIYLGHQAGLVERAERAWVPRVALNIAVSADDATELQRIAGGGRFVVVPNGVDVDFFTPADSEPREQMVFVGGTSYYPNLDALRWFASDILPEIRRLGCQAPVMFVGRATDEERRHYRALGVQMTGYVEDIRPFVRESGCFIAPLRVGGGTRLKLLDAWAMGKAVVSTAIGAEGLLVEDGGNALIRNDAAGFARAVVEVLANPALRRRLEKNARTTAQASYSWEVLERGMIAAYQRVMSVAERVDF